jgi:hypothetical protein
MRQLAISIVICLLFAFVTAGAKCGGAGGGGGGGEIGKAGESAAQKLAEWVGLWSDDAARGQRRPPPKLNIPAPPAVTFAAAAAHIGEDVGRASPPLADLRARVWNEGTQQATEYTQAALCEWFSWYVEDPVNRPVPDSETFLFLLARGALKVDLAIPVENEIRDAAELFRNAIERGQNLTEDTRNAAMAAACSVPVGG